MNTASSRADSVTDAAATFHLPRCDTLPGRRCKHQPFAVVHLPVFGRRPSARFVSAVVLFPFPCPRNAWLMKANSSQKLLDFLLIAHLIFKVVELCPAGACTEVVITVMTL